MTKFVSEYLNEWFTTNNLSINFDKTRFIQFTTKIDPKLTWTCYTNKLISKARHTKFLAIHIENTLSWKTHIDQIQHTLSADCYAISSVKVHKG
jgi:hypothetical protein